MPLPCVNVERAVRQVEPTKDLLQRMDELHPDILLAHDIEPSDYHGSLVLRSALESLRGSYAARMVSPREAMVAGALAQLKARGWIQDYKRTGGQQRLDFQVEFSHDPLRMGEIEVKGGEGPSIQISERDLWAQEFIIWSHLDGSIGNSPGHGAEAILGRIASDLVERGKHVDCLIIKDGLCGTPIRPCPKYPGREAEVGNQGAPCIFLLPKDEPVPERPEPEVHTAATLRLPFMMLDAFGVPSEERDIHLYQVSISLEFGPPASGKGIHRWRRRIRVARKGEVVVDKSTVVRRQLEPPD